jgi:hypothetical protein
VAGRSKTKQKMAALLSLSIKIFFDQKKNPGLNLDGRRDAVSDERCKAR